MPAPTRPLLTTMTSITDLTVGPSSKTQLSSASVPAVTDGILVTAHPNNSAVVRISGSDVTATHGQPLGPGASYVFPVSNAMGLYAFAESSTQTICVSSV